MYSCSLNTRGVAEGPVNLWVWEATVLHLVMPLQLIYWVAERRPSWQIDGETGETVADFIFLGSKITADGDCSHEIKRCLLLGRKVMTNLDSILKSRDITLLTKVRLVKAMVFPVVMYGCESWTIKKAECWRIDAFEVLKKTLESPLDCKEIQPVHPKGYQPWVLIGRTDVEAETLILWPPDVESWLIWKDPDAGKDWGQEEKGTTEDEMVEWHHRHNGHGFRWTLGGLVCCGSWGRSQRVDMTEWLNWTDGHLGQPSQQNLGIYSFKCSSFSVPCLG